MYANTHSEHMSSVMMCWNALRNINHLGIKNIRENYPFPFGPFLQGVFDSYKFSFHDSHFIFDDKKKVRNFQNKTTHSDYWTVSVSMCSAMYCKYLHLRLFWIKSKYLWVDNFEPHELIEFDILFFALFFVFNTWRANDHFIKPQ